MDEVPEIDGVRALLLTLLAGAGTLGVVFAAGFFLSLGDSGVESLLAGVTRARRDVVVLGLAQAGGFGLAISLARGGLRLGNEELREREGWLPPSPEVLVLSAVAGLGLYPLLAQLVAVLRVDPASSVFEAVMLQPSGMLEGFFVVVALVVVAPIAEEWLFRGILLPGMVQAHGLVTGLFGSALLFGAIHGSWVGVAYGGAAGLVLGALRLRTGSLWAPIVLHAASNSLPLLVPARVFPVPGFNLPAEPGVYLPVHLVLGGAVLALTAFAAMHYLDREPDDGEAE